MKCGIVTPVGPGHLSAYNACKMSIEIAANRSTGPFNQIQIFPVFDLDGQLGRSKARNLGVREARHARCDWIFFIDADDLMYDEAFENINETVHNFDAIWGLICEAPFDNLGLFKIRDRQLKKTTSFKSILNTDPFLSLQMGLFIKTDIAFKIPFDENLNTGEDFKFYLEIWSKYRCIKDEKVLFVNLRGNHSKGPRSANGAMWRREVEKQLTNFKTKFTQI